MIKIALISDIHGNAIALDAALTEIKKAAPDQIVCLGDVVVTGPQPRAALARVRELGCPVVRGNTDDWVLTPRPFDIRKDSDQILYDIERWSAEQLTEEDRAFIRTFQPTVTVDLGHGRSLLCSHGSPRRFVDAIEATTPDDEVAAMLAGHEATIFAAGHTHTPLLRRFRRSTLLNPGSVGLPFYRRPDGQFINLPWAEYALVVVQNGRTAITLHHVPYPLPALQDAVRRSTMPHPDAFLADWEAPPPAMVQ